MMSRYRYPILKLSLFTLLGLLLAWGAAPVLAATYTATDETSLANAITAATSSGDTINMSAGITIQLTANLPTITNPGLTINGTDATIKGGTNIRIFTVDTGANVTIHNLTMQYGNCAGLCPDAGTATTGDTGGAIYNAGTMTILSSTLSSNTAAEGGAIANEGTLSISYSTLSSNNASTGSGGSIYDFSGTMTVTDSTFSDNYAYNGGGGIASDGTLTVTGSTFSGNTGDYGGGLYNNTGTMTIVNSTISGNNSYLNGGAGVYNDSTMTITNSTIAGNSFTGTFGGNFYNNAAATATLNNTLISKGGAIDNCINYGTISSNGAAYNLADDGTCGANVTQVASLGLSTLGANGGSTLTIPLVVGSPAIDAALMADCPATDQRGETRPAGAGCDIGAFEGAITLPLPALDLAPTAVPAPALCSLTGFSASTQVAVSLPNGNNGLSVCYSVLSDPAQVGITQPFTLAADVYTFDGYGSVTTGVAVQVCLQGTGTLLYRDASGQPRTTINLPSFSQGGFTCGIIPNAGTVILMPGASSPAAAIPSTPLSTCRVTAANIVNLRAAPDINSAVLTQVPYQTVMSASARSGDWIQVVYGSQQGWVAERYVRLARTCK